MNIKTFDVSRQMAEDKYQEYLKAVNENDSPEYRALKEAFYHTKEGRKVIDISVAIKSGGVNNELQPNLAIVRANETKCEFNINSNGSCSYSGNYWNKRATIILPAETFSHETYEKYKFRRLEAIVPMIPPGIKPKGSLKRYHILWEADWKEVPKDPILLRHIYKYIYVVLAHWDLTEIEMAVLK